MRTNLVKTSQPRAWQSRVCPPKFSQVSGLIAFASQLASLKYTKSSSVCVCVCVCVCARERTRTHAHMCHSHQLQFPHVEMGAIFCRAVVSK